MTKLGHVLVLQMSSPTAVRFSFFVKGPLGYLPSTPNRVPYPTSNKQSQKEGMDTFQLRII